MFLHDVPGFIVGSAVERQGIIRHGAKMLFAVSEATVPKVSIVLRKSYGAGYFVMNGTAYEADYIAVWPTAEIAVMGPDGMVNIIGRKELEKFPEGKERDQARIAMAEELRANIDPYIAAGHAAIDAVIDPADTRHTIWNALKVSATKQVDRPGESTGSRPSDTDSSGSVRLVADAGDGGPDDPLGSWAIKGKATARLGSVRGPSRARPPGRSPWPPAHEGCRR